MTATLPVLRVGQTVELTFRHKQGRRVITALVSHVRAREAGPYFSYVPVAFGRPFWRASNRDAGTWGIDTLRPEPKPFGLQSLRILRDVHA